MAGSINCNCNAKMVDGLLTHEAGCASSFKISLWRRIKHTFGVHLWGYWRPRNLSLYSPVYRNCEICGKEQEKTDGI